MRAGKCSFSKGIGSEENFEKYNIREVLEHQIRIIFDRVNSGIVSYPVEIFASMKSQNGNYPMEIFERKFEKKII